MKKSMDCAEILFWDGVLEKAGSPPGGPRRYEVSLHERVYKPCLCGIICLDDDDAFIESVDRDDFFLTKVDQRGVLLRIFPYLLGELDGTEGVGMQLDLVKLLNRECRDAADATRIIRSMERTIRTFA